VRCSRDVSAAVVENAVSTASSCAPGAERGDQRRGLGGADVSSRQRRPDAGRARPGARVRAGAGGGWPLERRCQAARAFGTATHSVDPRSARNDPVMTCRPPRRSGQRRLEPGIVGMPHDPCVRRADQLEDLARLLRTSDRRDGVAYDGACLLKPEPALRRDLPRRTMPDIDGLGSRACSKRLPPNLSLFVSAYDRRPWTPSSCTPSLPAQAGKPDARGGTAAAVAARLRLRRQKPKGHARPPPREAR